MRRKGFTLIELLVVIAIIAMLLAILMPALNKVKILAQRLICGTNVKGLGTSMGVYANDYEDKFPVQGGMGNHPWLYKTPGWDEADRDWDNADDSRPISVGASLYLLVRNADVDTKSFVCPASDETAYDGYNLVVPTKLDIVELWDFGLYNSNDAVWRNHGPRNHVSYAYQLPYQVNASFPAQPADSTAGASVAILADKNPWCDHKLQSGIGIPEATLQKNYEDYVYFLTPNASTSSWRVQIANSEPHRREGQNVLFGDGHSTFEKRSDVSYQLDNIYTHWRGNGPTYTDEDKQVGACQVAGDPLLGGFPRSEKDAFLVNDDSRNPSTMSQ